MFSAGLGSASAAAAGRTPIARSGKLERLSFTQRDENTVVFPNSPPATVIGALNRKGIVVPHQNITAITGETVVQLRPEDVTGLWARPHVPPPLARPVPMPVVVAAAAAGAAAAGAAAAAATTPLPPPLPILRTHPPRPVSRFGPTASAAAAAASGDEFLSVVPDSGAGVGGGSYGSAAAAYPADRFFLRR